MIIIICPHTQTYTGEFPAAMQHNAAVAGGPLAARGCAAFLGTVAAAAAVTLAQPATLPLRTQTATTATARMAEKILLLLVAAGVAVWHQSVDWRQQLATGAGAGDDDNDDDARTGIYQRHNGQRRRGRRRGRLLNGGGGHSGVGRCGASEAKPPLLQLATATATTTTTAASSASATTTR